MEGNNNINGENIQMLEKKRKRPTYGVLTLKPEELQHYVDTTGLKRRLLKSDFKEKKVCKNKKSKTSKKTSNKKLEQQK